MVYSLYSLQLSIIERSYSIGNNDITKLVKVCKEIGNQNLKNNLKEKVYDIPALRDSNMNFS